MKTNLKDQKRVMADILTAYFEIPKDEAMSMAEKIIPFINNKASAFISTNDSLPDAEPLSDPCGTYYTIKVENFGERRAMFLFDETGEKAWYSSYIDKIIRHVTHYQPEFK